MVANSVAHIAVPVLASATDADRSAVLGDVGYHDNLGASRHAPALTEDVEFDVTEATRESDLLWRRDVLVTEEDDAVIAIGPLDRGERCIVEGFSQIDTADLGTQRRPGRDDLDGHGQSPCW